MEQTCFLLHCARLRKLNVLTANQKVDVCYPVFQTLHRFFLL